MNGSCEPGKRALQDHKGSLKTLMVAVTEIEESFLAFLSIEMVFLSIFEQGGSPGLEGASPRGVSP